MNSDLYLPGTTALARTLQASHRKDSPGECRLLTNPFGVSHLLNRKGDKRVVAWQHTNARLRRARFILVLLVMTLCTLLGRVTEFNSHYVFRGREQSRTAGRVETPGDLTQ
jgi:hypothetical protein